MNALITELDFLFAVIALQLDFIDAGQFAEACSAWETSRHAILADLLIERGWITPGDRAEIDRIVRRKLERRGGSVRRSLGDALAPFAAGETSSASLDDGLDYRTGLEAGASEGSAIAQQSTVDQSQETRERFRLVRMYAQGGLGRVWLARDPVLGREVALKELRPEKADDPTSRARFLREARITGKLDHPGIVTVHELASQDGNRRAFYAMQLVRGRTLREAVRDYHTRYGSCPGGALELHALLEDFIGVCNAVAYAHSRGVIHRDLKGQNIILGDFGEVVVLDWGLAKVISGGESAGGPEGGAVEPLAEGESGLTLEGQRMGTPGFMAPEQVEGKHELVGVRSDIYGLGAILYEILTGSPPFSDSGVTEALRRVREENPPAPRQLCSAIPGPLEAISLKALSKRPEDRYANASELAQDVRRWLADEPVSVYRETIAERFGRWGRRHKTTAIVASSLLAALVMALVAVVLLASREQARTRAALVSESRHRRLAEADLVLARLAVDGVDSASIEEPRPSEAEIGSAAVAARRQLAARPTDQPVLAFHQARALFHFGGLIAATGRRGEAAGYFRDARSLWEALPGRFREEYERQYRDGLDRAMAGQGASRQRSEGAR